MPDSTLAAIDRFFDLVDSGVEKIDHVLNRGKRTEALHRTRRAGHSAVLDAKAVAPKAAKKSTSTALACKVRFYIVESISAEGTLFVVTDGGNARAECSTREIAEKVLRALEVAV